MGDMRTFGINDLGFDRIGRLFINYEGQKAGIIWMW